ncbi:GNAT family N-acetyltransferase [uncultured Tyzzerella sp.]|uniref:GNAT family N-acetyltransferase n=1 Tax=uncultured Tyzzerella sp. TaxID=2321398 RepID=UPI0029424DE8|nr:GNAT family N-acetyltransferase [uncultured Tyzzerella sp.]
MKIKIRDAKETDLKNIANIYVSSWKKAFSKFLLQATINKLNVNEKEKILCDILLEKGNILIAENTENNEICGYIVYKNVSKISIEIISFYVNNSYTIQGIGTQLLNNLKLYCSKNFITSIVLWTFKNNIEAIKFYKSLGFYETGFQKQSDIELGQIEVQYMLK